MSADAPKWPDYRPQPGTIPSDPGVYKFRDAQGRVIYVGKAKVLKNRLANYFQPLERLHPRTRRMVTSASSVEWTVVANEVEALQLEWTWIKKFDPRFNVMFRDDKSYPMLAVSTGELYPRVFIYRGARRKGIRYFGPYSNPGAIRETIELLTRIFPVRTCTKGVFNRHKQLGRPCLQGYIDRCSAPCVGKISLEDHRALVDQYCSFMNGNTGAVKKSLMEEMLAASEALDFEKAAKLHESIKAIDKVTEKQTVVLGEDVNADVIGHVADELEMSIQIFHIRNGRIRGQQGWVVSVDDAADTLGDFILQFYGNAADLAENQESMAKADLNIDSTKNSTFGAENHAGTGAATARAEASPIPREILVDLIPSNDGELVEWLRSRRGAGVELRIPQRGDKVTLMETVQKNAQEALRQHKMRRVGDLTARSAAMNELQENLFLEKAPLRIECTDISHIQGTDVVASLVVFEDGLPKKADYRRYKIKEAAGDGHSNDVASIAEVTRRRFSNEELPRPELFIVDGGAPQVAAAQEVFDELGIVDVALIGLAKRLEEVWVPGEEDPLILPRTSQGLFLLQQARDESHRFAITFHRQQRSKRMTQSELDTIPGLGEKRRVELVKHFGSVAKIKKASEEDIAAVPGFGKKLAATVYEALHSTVAE
ncbi:MAG: excinuclease ABC subunit UvrC [Corynebacterium sp.]|nr:excinuclease ABC subunit UvrC [Corynebacterium sp.]